MRRDRPKNRGEEVEIDTDEVSRAIKHICDTLHLKKVNRMTAAAALKVLVMHLEDEGVVVEVTRLGTGEEATH